MHQLVALLNSAEISVNFNRFFQNKGILGCFAAATKLIYEYQEQNGFSYRVMCTVCERHFSENNIKMMLQQIQKSCFLCLRNVIFHIIYYICYMCSPLAGGVIQGNMLKIKRERMTHSINPCLITSDPIISDTGRSTPMHG